MSKFGELIEARIPVLLNFYTEESVVCRGMNKVLKDVAASFGEQAKVIKIDIDKNKELSEALRVKEIPTLMIYKNGEMKWRQSGDQDASTLIGLIREYL